jgi:hypothetical protein
MKIIQLSFAIVAISLLLTACSKNNEDLHTIDPPALGPVLLWPGEDSLFTPEGNPQVTKVSSDNEAVVKATVQGSKIKLSAGITGSTNIRITDNADHTFPREVRSMNLTFQWKSLTNETYTTNVTVAATDAAFAQTLSTELTTQATIPLDMSFAITDASTFRYRLANAGNNVVEGSFSFSNLTLTLNRNDSKVEVYQVIPYANRMILGLRQDLTAYYQSLYPNKGITTVIITRHIKQNPPLG